jgi:hypothetical protein
MQVVINRKAGSFSLSDAALLEVYRLNAASLALKVVTPDEAAADAFFDEMFFVKAEDGNYVQTAFNASKAQACPTLVDVVRRLGARASSDTATLEVIDVPQTLEVYGALSGESVPMPRRVRTFV